jgi:hypothetical protein
MKLSQQELPTRGAKQVLAILRDVKAKTDEYHKERIEFLSERAEKDAAGKPKAYDAGHFVLDESKKAEINKFLVSLMTKKVKLPKVKPIDLKNATLTAQEYSLLEEVIG